MRLRLNPPAPAAQLGMHAQAAIAAVTDRMNGANFGAAYAVGSGTRALCPLRPGIAAAAAHAQHFAHDPDREVGDVVANDGITHLRSVALPKMSAARFKVSHSIRSRSFSRRSCAISAA